LNFRRFVDTPSDLTLTLIRVGLAIVFFPHGAQKALGWWGGFGFSATMDAFTPQYGPVLAFLAIAAEFAGSLGLLLGLFGRVAAFGLLCNMLVAVFMVHSKFGFFMNWQNNHAGEGFEFHILAITMLLVILIRGSGAFSVDRALVEKTR